MRRLTAIFVAAIFVASMSGPTVLAAEKVKIFVFAEPDANGLGTVPASLVDSVKDIQFAIDQVGLVRHWGTKHRADAAVVVRVLGREEINGEYRVRAHVAARNGHEVDVAGTSAHQWKKAAVDLVDQIMTWVKANEASLQTR